MQFDFSNALTSLLVAGVVACVTMLWRLSISVKGLSGTITGAHNELKGLRSEVEKLERHGEVVTAAQHEHDKRIALLERTRKIQ